MEAVLASMRAFADGCAPGPGEQLLNNVGFAGHLAVIMKLRGACDSLLPAVQGAVEGGRVDLVISLLTSGADAPVSIVEDAAYRGHLRLVRWLLEEYGKDCSSRVLDRAAEGGHLDIVRWLSENRTESCTVNAMDYAALNGHLEVVCWLSENRTEGCTTRAMVWAAGKGHLEIVRWLSEMFDMP
jgi:hypothetical protein